MSNETSSADQQPHAGQTGPGFAPPALPSAPTGYGAQPAPVGPQPPSSTSPAPEAYASPAQPVEQEQHWTSEGLVSTPALPPERVGHGALLGLLAIPAGAVVAGIIAELGYIATLSSIVTAALAAVLYARGSGGRVKKGIPVIALTILVGLVVSFFTSVAVELWKAFPTIDPDVAASYPTRGGFVSSNLFYPPVLGEAAKEAGLFILLGVVVGCATVFRLVRRNATLQR